MSSGKTHPRAFKLQGSLPEGPAGRSRGMEPARDAITGHRSRCQSYGMPRRRSASLTILEVALRPRAEPNVAALHSLLRQLIPLVGLDRSTGITQPLEPRRRHCTIHPRARVGVGGEVWIGWTARKGAHRIGLPGLASGPLKPNSPRPWPERLQSPLARMKPCFGRVSSF